MIGASNGHGAVVEALVASRACFDTSDHWGRQSMHMAAASGHRSVIDALAVARASLAARDADQGGQALHFAAAMGHLAAVQALVSQRADLAAKDRFAKRPMSIATSRGHRAVTEEIKKL